MEIGLKISRPALAGATTRENQCASDTGGEEGAMVGLRLGGKSGHDSPGELWQGLSLLACLRHCSSSFYLAGTPQAGKDAAQSTGSEARSSQASHVVGLGGWWLS